MGHQNGGSNEKHTGLLYKDFIRLCKTSDIQGTRFWIPFWRIEWERKSKMKWKLRLQNCWMRCLAF